MEQKSVRHQWHGDMCVRCGLERKVVSFNDVNVKQYGNLSYKFNIDSQWVKYRPKCDKSIDSKKSDSDKINNLKGDSKSIVGSILLTNDVIIKVTHKSNLFIYGFNLITEELVKISVLEKYLENPEVILHLLKDEKIRYNYANAISSKKTIKQKAELLGVSDRTYYRILNGEFMGRDTKREVEINTKNLKNLKVKQVK